MINKLGLYLLLLVFATVTLQAQVPGSPVIWKAKKKPIPCALTSPYKSSTVDTDGDGVFDACDIDTDNDGIIDTDEDTNNDGNISNDDWDGNYYTNPVGDFVPNFRDLDSENDGVLDLWETGIPISILNTIDADKNGIIDVGVPVGTNGYADILETFPDSGIPKFALADTDCDGVYDFIDITSNGTNYDLHVLGHPEYDTLNAGFIFPFEDLDHDGIMDIADTDDDVRGAPAYGMAIYPNTTLLSLDANGNDILDDCEPQCVYTPSYKAISIDTDNDGFVDVCDLDSDNDGILDSCENDNDISNFLFNNFDGDLIPNYLDLDSDNDAVLDLWESGIPISVLNAIDADKNGVIDAGIPVGTNGFADVLETFPDSGVAKYALDKTISTSLNFNYLNVISNGVDFDIALIMRNDLDFNPANGIIDFAYDDNDGIADQLDTDLGFRGSPGSGVAAHPNNTLLTTNPAFNGCVPVPATDLVPSFVLGNDVTTGYLKDTCDYNIGVKITNSGNLSTSGTITVVMTGTNNGDQTFVNYDTAATTANIANENFFNRSFTVNNPDWNCAVVTQPNGLQIITLTSKPGVVIPSMSSVLLSIVIKEEAFGGTNFQYTLNVTPVAGEINTANNLFNTFTLDSEGNTVSCNTCLSGSFAPNLNGVTSVTNACPQTTFNLSNITVSGTPPGAVVTWHTGNVATNANKLTNAQRDNAPAGNYYAAFFNPSASCYSPTTPVVVTVTNCP